MQESLSRMVNVSDREINRLQGSFSKLEQTFSKLKARKDGGRGGPLTDAAISQNQQQYFAGISDLNRVNDAKGTFNSNLRAMNPTFGDKAKAFLGIPQGGFPPGTNPMNMLGAVAGSPFGAVSAGMGLGWKIGGTLAAVGNSYESSNLGYAMDKPMIDLQNRASIGGTYGSMAVRARSGAVSQQLALNRLLQNKQYDMIFGKGSFESDVAKVNTEIKTGVWGNLGAGSLGAAYDSGTQKMGRLWSNFHSDGVVDKYGTDLTPQEIALKTRLRSASGAQVQRFGQAMSHEEASDPYLNQVANDVYSGAFSDISGINASRTSGNVKYDKWGAPIMTDYDALKARLQKSGHDPGSIFGEMTQLSDQVGRRLSGSGTATKLSDLKTGGFSSASSIFGVGSQFGGGLDGGNNLIKTFQDLIGSGRKKGTSALDVGAGSLIGQMVANEMNSGRFTGGSGTGFAAVALNAAYTGNTGTEMRNAHQMPSGLAQLDAVSSGSKDSLQGGLNMAAANAAAPGASWQTKRALMDLDAASLMDISINGSSSKAFSDLAGTGVTPDMVGKYQAKQHGTLLSEVNDSMLSPEGRKTRNAFLSKGIKYLKDFKEGGARENEIRSLGNVLNTAAPRGTNRSASYEEARLLASEAHLVGQVAGRGAGRSLSKHSLTAHAAIDTGTNTAGVGHKKAENETIIRETGHEGAGAAPLFDKTGMAGVAALETQSVTQLVTANESLDKMVRLLGQLVGLNGGDDKTHGNVSKTIRRGKAGLAKIPSSVSQ